MPEPASHSITHHASGAQLCTFSNGLTVILMEDHSAPVVSAQAWCQAGSIHEGKWLGAGLSHVLEHMLFKGTQKRGKGRIDQEVQEAGGYMNAYTSFDRTVYYINAPSTGTGVAVDILADIMRHASLPEDELTSELDVIRREMDMNQDDPSRRSARGLFETAYLHSPYRYTVIGYPDVFNRITREDILSYYRRMYVPSNQFFVIVGDIQSDAVIEQLGLCYQDALFQPIEPLYLPEEPKQSSSRFKVEESSIELGHAHTSWHIPELLHADIPALEALSIVLGGGRSSRLYQQLREKQGLVHAIDAWTYNPGLPGLFGVSAVFDGNRYEDVIQGIDQQLKSVIEKGIQDEELHKAIKQLTSATLSTRKTMQGQAQDLGSSWMAARDLGFSDQFLNQVQHLKTEALQSTAERYLQPNSQSLYCLLPRHSSPKPPVVKVSNTSEEIESWLSPEGVRVLFKRDHRLPFVAIRSVFFGGVLTEQETDNGITHWMTQGLLKGTESTTAAELMRQVESVGGSLESYAGNNSFGIQLECMRQETPQAIGWLKEILKQATFPEGEMERERQVQLAGIRSQRDQLLGRCLQLMRKGLFGANHYGLTSLGQESSLQGLTREQVIKHANQWIHPGNQVLAVFGDIEPNEIKAQLTAFWGHSASSQTTPQSCYKTLNSQKLPTSQHENCDKKQAVLAMGFKGCLLGDHDRHALDCLQETCSDLGSRLFMRIRDELGLAYYVGAQHMPGLIPGYFAFYAGTSPNEIQRVRDEMWQQIQILADKGITQQELKRAKAKLLGQKKIARQSLGSLATQCALDELYGLGYMNQFEEEQAIESVQIEDVQRAAAKYFTESGLSTATVGPDQGS